MTIMIAHDISRREAQDGEGTLSGSPDNDFAIGRICGLSINLRIHEGIIDPRET